MATIYNDFVSRQDLACRSASKHRVQLQYLLAVSSLAFIGSIISEICAGLLISFAVHLNPLMVSLG
jgi:hypothetical protein